MNRELCTFTCIFMGRAEITSVSSKYKSNGQNMLDMAALAVDDE